MLGLGLIKLGLSKNLASMNALRMMSSSGSSIIFRQLFEPVTCTYTYILADAKSRKAVIIDPVLEKVDRDLKFINEMDLDLVYALNTHVHADHVTGSGKIKSKLSKVKSVISEISKAKADVHLKNGDEVKFGDLSLIAVSTPGHTDGCMSYISHQGRSVFTGDALLIRGCGRTDFQQGNPSLLYNSVHKKILSLPEDYLIYPGHDYNGLMSSSVREEKKYNPRLTKSETEFIDIMKNLNLPYPKQIDIAVPANMVCGIQDSV